MIRLSLSFAIDRYGCPKKAVEIGVWDGSNAYAMLSESQIKFLVLVDAYSPYLGGKNNQITQEQQDINKWAMLSRLRKHCHKVVFMPMLSAQAVRFFPNDFFDYAYIDANHKYEFVKEDNELWYSKVKPGGVLAGHDYGGDFNGVTQAVDEFAEKNNLKLYTFSDFDWCIEKP